MSLSYRVFLHSYEGWNSTSTLFYGERDAVLGACRAIQHDKDGRSGSQL